VAFDEGLADRIRRTLGRRKGLTEKRMFGGIGFLLNGNLCCGVRKAELLIRIDPAASEGILAQAHTRPFDIARRGPMKGWVLVKPAALKSDAQLRKWVDLSATYATTLPAK
jgi:TfoX/Sxy family transcriptional regulator of competence genes